MIMDIFKPANHSRLGVILSYLKGRNIFACLLYKKRGLKNTFPFGNVRGFFGGMDINQGV